MSQSTFRKTQENGSCYCKITTLTQIGPCSLNQVLPSTVSRDFYVVLLAVKVRVNDLLVSFEDHESGRRYLFVPFPLYTVYIYSMSETNLFVADVSISMHGSSCNSHFFGFKLAPLLSLSLYLAKSSRQDEVDRMHRIKKYGDRSQ